MVKEVIWDKKFEAALRKIKDKKTKDHIKKNIKKILNDPETGKPLRYGRRGEREVRVRGSRLIYCYVEDTLTFLCFIPHTKL